MSRNSYFLLPRLIRGYVILCVIIALYEGIFVIALGIKLSCISGSVLLSSSVVQKFFAEYWGSHNE